MRWIDISTPIRPGMAGFPGDPPVEFENVRSLKAGAPYALSKITMGSHVGTHVDPPAHFLEGGASADQLDLDRLNGPALVHQLPETTRRVTAEELRKVPPGTHRLLLRTSNSDRWESASGFFPDYVALDPSAAERLVELEVRLVGVDSLSIESDPAEQYPVHHRLLRAGVAILEGLRLASVVPGSYELRCLPLRLVGADGAPARAVLRRI